MDNSGIARAFEKVADRLEIKGTNPFKIRTYRAAADIASATHERIDNLSDTELRVIPGIGKDLAAKLGELAEHGFLLFHQDLLKEFPASILELLQLQRIGAKSVAMLHARLGIVTIDQLERAATEAHLRSQRGLGPRKEQLILRSIGERRSRAGRHLLANVHDVAETLIHRLRARHAGATLVPVASMRRGCETCGDVDILATGTDSAIMPDFVGSDAVNRILGQGETKSNILLHGGLQAGLRVVPEVRVGASRQDFTGSREHNTALRDHALQRGLKLNEYRLFRIDGGALVAGVEEPAVYEAVDLSFIPSEHRKNRAELFFCRRDHSAAGTHRTVAHPW